MPSSVALKRPARAIDQTSTIALLVDAFADDAAVFYPTDWEYRRHFPGFLMAFGGRAFEQGGVDVDSDGNAAALWFPPGLEPDGEAILNHMAATMPPERLAALGPGMEMQNTMHPQEAHWYLPWMGVRPEMRGKGLGAELLRAGLARADAEGMPAYLEATKRRNAALYARHGFVTLSVVELEGYPEIIGMWRPTQAR